MMLTQTPPWSTSNLQDAMEYNEEIQEMFRLGFAEYVRTRQPWCLGLLSADLIDLLQGMFRLDPRDRLSLTQIRAHKWTRGPVSIP
jgi:serine/threonine protein kinase